MAYIEGQSLAESTRGKSLPPRQVAALVGKLAVALQEAHAKGVIHRDLKPSNIMIKSTGQRREPVIVDFGLARRDDAGEARLTKTGQVMGTLDYMAPEQIRGDLKEIGPACDIYALGVILYELLTGRLPFQRLGTGRGGPDPDPGALAPVDVPARPRPPARGDLPEGDGQEGRPDRYASMAELAAALTDYLRSSSAVRRASEAAARPSRAGSTGEHDRFRETDSSPGVAAGDCFVAATCVGVAVGGRPDR